PKADVNKIVKQFVRTSGKSKIDLDKLRPGHVLVETVNYLLTKVVPVKDVSWNVVYDYVWDRLRAIRQDMVIQNIQGNTKITILESCVLFHLYSSYVLCEEELRLFDPTLNAQQLKECLEVLIGQFDETVLLTTKRRHIFESIFLLYNLDSSKALQRFGCLPRDIQNNNLVKKSYAICIWYANCNYYRILQEFGKLPTVMKLALNRHINHIHFEYLRRMCVAYHSMNCRIAITTLAGWLCPFESPELALKVLRQLCRDYGVKIVAAVAVQFDKNSFNKIEKTEVLILLTNVVDMSIK
ncbi:SAC3 domain-containing protein 1-like protein, partial [Leptotrombidium deliense]